MVGRLLAEVPATGPRDRAQADTKTAPPPAGQSRVDKDDRAKGDAKGKEKGKGAAKDGGTGDTADRLTYPYTVELTGIPDDAIARTARELSDLFQDKDRPPATRLGLRRRMEDDADKLRRYLRSEAYYAVKVEISADTSAKPAKVTIKVDMGPRYLLTVFKIVDPEGKPLAAAPSLETIGVKLDVPGRSALIVSAQERMLAAFANKGYPFAQVARRQVIVDHKTRAVEVTLFVRSGGLTRFGPVRIEGLKRAKADFVRNSIAWKEGEVFDAAKVRATRSQLIDTGVFGSITITPIEKERGPDGRAPMLLKLGERKPRTLEVGANYSTDFGPGGSISWIHRNLFGRGERLRIKADSSFKDRSAFAQLTFPNFFDGPQKLLLTTQYSNVNYDAYDGHIFLSSAVVDRRINRHLRISAGVSFEHSILDETGVDERYNLFGVPFALHFDDTDHLLDPTRGIRIDLELTPFQGHGPSGGLLFAQATGKISGYWKPWKDRGLVLAGWFKLGTVVGEKRQDIPINKRLFAGGGGSVRGFGFQRIAPLNSAGNPSGGRSLVGFGVEARFRIKGNFGGVVFLEGATVGESVTPSLSEPIRWGAGFGVRYYTAFGPIRLDLGFPLNRRSGDAIFQVYISIGQSF